MCGSTCWITVSVTDDSGEFFLGRSTLGSSKCFFSLKRGWGNKVLVHLPSRHATFRLQFIQRFLTGPMDLVWRKTAEVILHTVDGLGLDAGLFLMDVKQLRLAGLPQFYCGLF